MAEGLRSAIKSIRAHAFRSFLTALGIIIGVASIVAMVSIIQGLSFFIYQQFQGLGSNSITIQSYTSLSDRLEGRIARLTQDDLNMLGHRVTGIESITPIMFLQNGGQIRYGSQTAFTQILGTTYSYQDVAQYYTEQGRFISDSDNQTRRRVCVIGEEVRTNLALPEDPLGEFILIQGEWIKIIGLLEPRGEILGNSQDNQVLLPFSTMQSLIGNQRQPDIRIQMTIADVAQMDGTIAVITRLLRRAHGLRPEDADDFRIQTAEQLTSTFNTIINTVTVVMAGIVGISLLVGGIGIMNIMLVSVTERTREIGICKAIGAKRHHIMLQFLLEALMLCLIGGLIGIAIGYGLGGIVASMIPGGFPEAHTPVWAVALALAFSAGVGVVFGLLPAAKASKLDPITSLRYE